MLLIETGITGYPAISTEKWWFTSFSLITTYTDTTITVYQAATVWTPYAITQSTVKIFKYVMGV